MQSSWDSCPAYDHFRLRLSEIYPETGTAERLVARLACNPHFGVEMINAIALDVSDVPIDNFTAGWLGGVFFLGMAVAVVLLWRNMNSRLKRIDKKFEDKE